MQTPRGINSQCRFFLAASVPASFFPVAGPVVPGFLPRFSLYWLLLRSVATFPLSIHSPTSRKKRKKYSSTLSAVEIRCLFSAHPLLLSASLPKFFRRSPLLTVPCVQNVTNPAFQRAPVLAVRSPGTDALFLSPRLPSILHACIKNSLVPLCSWLSPWHLHRVPPFGTLNLLRNPLLLFQY